MMRYSILRQIQFLLEKMNLRQNSYRQVESVRWSKRVRARTPLISLSLSLSLVSFSLSLLLVSFPRLSDVSSYLFPSLPYLSSLCLSPKRDEGKRHEGERQRRETRGKDKGERRKKEIGERGKGER